MGTFLLRIRGGATSAASSSQNKFLFYEGRNDNYTREDDVERYNNYNRSSKYRDHDKDDYNYRGGSKHKDYNQPSRYSRSRGRDRGARRSKEKEDERDRYDRRGGDRSRSKEVNKEENNDRGRSRYGNRREGSKDKDKDIARKKCYSYTLCCRPSKTDKHCHARICIGALFRACFPVGSLHCKFSLSCREICVAELTTNV